MDQLQLFKNLLKIKTLLISLLISVIFISLFYFLYLNSSDKPLYSKLNHFFGMVTNVILGILFFSVTYLSFIKSNFFKFVEIHFKDEKNKFLTYIILFTTLFFAVASVLSYFTVSLVVEKQVNFNILVFIILFYFKILLVNLVSLVSLLHFPHFWTIICLIFYSFFEDSIFLFLQNTQFSIIAKLLPFQNFNLILYGKSSIYNYLYFIFLFYILYKLILNQNLVRL